MGPFCALVFHRVNRIKTIRVIDTMVGSLAAIGGTTVGLDFDAVVEREGQHLLRVAFWIRGHG